MHQHRLGLVVGVVAHGEDPGARPARHAGQEGIAGAAGGLLHRQALPLGQGRHVGVLQVEGQAPIGRQGPHERRVGVGLGPAQPMVQVSHVQVQIPAGPQPVEQVQQA
ncbi:MAG: hypothetical protein P8129_18225 [Anaerolineae bacterium]